ncbi:4Fe-4S dicluster domain-containing protein [Desulfoferrobacter suflitae]|uniref:4Fe-4S dicluster domain-containing protein n=1 Tax=Desulfoferrobacter suflitae TaxID=2865782 RepID=UPI0021648BD8|nr:4Fe-4S dicluster domain-containing protein [Desulfoferrobacter suflitae]
MPITISEKTIKSDFIEKVKKLSGQNIHKCFQCGTCGGACPMSGQLATLPRKIMRMAQFGLENEVAESKTFWTCASCHSCSVTCPRGIDLAKVMEALRQLSLRKNVNYVEPSKLPSETVKEMPQIAMVSCFRKMTS